MSILGINETANPLLTILPIVLMLVSGYSVGIIISKVRRKATPVFLRDFIYGSMVLNFLFLSGFIIFGVLTSAAKEYFTAFTYILAALTIVGSYFLIKKLIVNVTSLRTGAGHRDKFDTVSVRGIKSLLLTDNQSIFILFGIALVAGALVYQAIIIYYHPIYSEYDSIYRFLPISKSILLGNGLNHDFYLGSDINMRHPPFIQAINAWLIHLFEYSSLRMFPFYYVFLATILVYSLSRNILNKTGGEKDAPFFALIASTAFLITPAILVVSSRFSLQQDLGFIFMMTASFYFLSEIVRYARPAKTTLLILSATLALMSLTREIGLVLSVALFFLVPAIKYTDGNLKLRAIFTILSFLLFYVLSFKDLFELGFTFATTTRMVVILLVNSAIYYILSQLKNQNKFFSLVRPISNIKYIAPIIIPLIFITTNMILFSGPFPIITFSGEFAKLLPTYREIFGISNPLTLDIFQSLENIPRIDILFISLAMGSIFIFFKLIGIGRIIYHLKNNYQYSLVVILLIFLLFTWSFLLHSRFQTSDIRYIAYFVPLLSVILIIGMKIRNVSSPYSKIFYCGFIVLATFYFLHFNIFTWHYNIHFAGFWIEPNIGSIMTWYDVRFAAVVMSGLILLELGREKYSPLVNKYNLQRYFVIVLILLIGIQSYNLLNSDLKLVSSEKLDQVPPRDWETNVFEVVNYLNNSEKGNVLSVRAPAIAFFTNRTNFDIFSPQTFAYTASPLLLTDNSSAFKEKIADLGIRYIVIPNKTNPLYYLIHNSTLESKLVPIIGSSEDFQKITLQNFTIYKYNPNFER